MQLDTWLFMRISGVFLMFALALHLLEYFFLRTTLLAPLAAFLVNLGIVGFCTSHALVGFKRVVDDQGIPHRAQTVLSWILVACGILFAYAATDAMQRFGLL